MSRTRRIVAIICLAGALLAPEGAAAAGVTVRLEATAGTRAPQGTPMRFRAVMTNAAPVDQAVALTFTVGRAGVPPVPFKEWRGTVPAESQLTIESDVVASQWFAGLGPYAIAAAEARLDFEVTPSPVAVPVFRDVTAGAGLTTRVDADVMCHTFAAGAAWGDVDGDGDLDLYLPRLAAPAQLFVNQGGTFIERAAAAGADNPGGRAQAAVMADYDNDGDQDIYVSNDGPNRLYRNDGTGRFTDVAPAAGVADDGNATGAAWGDYDNDGLLDLYVLNYFRCAAPGEEFGDDVLYHNEGDGTFTDRTALLGPPGTTRWFGFQASWFDYDTDGDLDLHLGNDAGPGVGANVLWRNDGRGLDGSWRFTNVTDAAGVGISINTMGTAIGDYDRDGDLDFALSNMGNNVLFRNEGNGTFTDRAAAARVARPEHRLGAMSVTWGLELRDLNNDGWEDLYVAAGDMAQPGDPIPAQPNAVFANGRDGTFLDLSAPSGADDPGQSRGVPVADFDRDGRLDVYVVNQLGAPRLYRNVTAGAGHWLEVDLRGVVSNPDGCGARLIAELRDGALLRRDVHCGSTSFASGSDTVVHFGLGESSLVRRLTVAWPSGAVQTLESVAADRLIAVREPLAPVNARPVAAEDQAATDEDAAVEVDVLRNDADPDGHPLRVSMVQNGRSGNVTCASRCTYRPAANFNGTDSFVYTVADGHGGVDTATVMVTVRPVNDAPVAVNDSAVTDEDVAVTFDVLANDTDVDGDRLRVARFDARSRLGAEVSCTGGGLCTYTPRTGETEAQDLFTYTASDGMGGIDTGYVLVTVRSVNVPPEAVDDLAITEQYEPVLVRVLDNDRDADHDPLLVESVTQAEHGTVTLDTDGTITYTPNPAFKGDDAFTYTVIDRNGGSDAATVSVVVRDCGEDGLASGAIDRELEVLAAGFSPELARMLHRVNCWVVVPAEGVLP